jgi:hypothetical protein
VDGDLARYRDAMSLIVEDDTIQGGAATFRGTRILVHLVENGDSVCRAAADRVEIATVSMQMRAHRCLL